MNPEPTFAKTATATHKPPKRNTNKRPQYPGSRNKSRNNLPHFKSKNQRLYKPRNEPLTKKPSVSSAHQNESSSESGEDESSAGEALCLICCGPLRFYSVGRCNHHEICSLCSVRRRRLYQQTDCCICKQQLDDVIFTADPYKKFSDFQFGLLSSTDLIPGVRFTDESYMKIISTMISEFRCTQCDDTFSALGGLKSHLRTSHKLLFCPVCLQHRKVFLHEQRLYTREELNRHLKPHTNGKGSPPGEVEHRHCEFCRISLYDKDALHAHLTEKHERCHLCAATGNPNLYFADYAALEKHFDKQHYFCREPSCVEKRFVVFRTALDLRAHDIEVHVPHRKFQSRAEEREARRLDIVFSSRDLSLPTGPRGGGSSSVVTVVESSSSSSSPPEDNFPTLIGGGSPDRSDSRNPPPMNLQARRMATGVTLNTEWGRNASTTYEGSSQRDYWPSLSNNNANKSRQQQQKQQARRRGESSSSSSASSSSWASLARKSSKHAKGNSPAPPPRNAFYGGAYGY